MTATNLLERLASHATVGAAPQVELAWVEAHGSLRRLDEGEVLTAKGGAVAGLFLVLAGRLAIFVDRGAGRRKVMEWRAGDVTGVLPYSRLVSPPGDVIAQEVSEVFCVPRGDIAGLIHDCPEITAILVHKMLDRASVFTATSLHDEKMVSLGKLSAGLAHELNNPASAIERSATLLEDRLEDAQRATRAMSTSPMSDTQRAAVDAVRASCLDARVLGVLSPLQRAEREESIADWLADHQLDPALAESLAETAVSLDALEAVAAAVTGPALGPALSWVAAECSLRGLLAEIQDAAVRISGLVAAVKGFTYMDQAPVAAPVDVGVSLGNTVTVLKAKARAKSIGVTVDVAPDLPPARAFGGELNQIWANLIDNAIDAAPESGQVEVTARVEHHRIVVRVTDNGAGIPAELRDRMFDPFVTTKPVGQGTGLGLDIVRRLVKHNDADIEVETRPGRTEFRVSLPAAGTAGLVS